MSNSGRAGSRVFLILCAIQLMTPTEIAGQEKQCVMFGKCGLNPDRPGTRYECNCKVTHPPVTMTDDDAFALLSNYCPELTAQYGRDLCCHPDQLRDLTNYLDLPQSLIGRCPSCYYNFRQTFCSLTCSPFQSQFLNGSNIIQNDNGQDMVKVLDVFLEENIAEDTYSSCKNVQHENEDGELMPVMQFLCGGFGAEFCSPTKWFWYMGSFNGYTPFNVRFQHIKQDQTIPGIIPFNFETRECGRSYEGEQRCECIDCPDSCPSPKIAESVHTRTN